MNPAVDLGRKTLTWHSQLGFFCQVGQLTGARAGGIYPDPNRIGEFLSTTRVSPAAARERGVAIGAAAPAAPADTAMSWSSGGSSAPGFRRASGRRDTDARSPVRYREQPMAYEPAMLCHCNPRRKAPRWISWSRQNPGRRYYACVNAVHGGCGYVERHDDPLPKFFSDLIGDLRDEVWRLKGGGTVARTEDAFAAVAMSEDEAGGEMLAMSLQEQLRLKNEEMDAMKSKYMNVIFVLIVFVLGLVLGKFVVN
uniref:Zinc finger GRF-type domain-containing protein n=1 Tax=Aegilops tauschii subsp. strangulata TaxID=200361 RepID=A0A453L0G0_AEGTS|nr:uncharacterized protein LOC120963989 [Aegilops tauschii subsp. strangulata]